MRIQPDSTITLYSGVDIDMSSGVQIAFSSIANQNAYFASKVVMSETPCTVVKKTGRIRLEVAGSVVKNCNYISFINPSFDNKRIYARIIDYDYINNECTEIAWMIDFWQTWMFDISFEKSGIQRQYLNETDFGRAETNPYDTRIYAFQTPEALPSNKSLEPRHYRYKIQKTSGAESDDLDGQYVLTSRIVGVDSTTILPDDWVKGGGTSLVIFLADIDYDNLPSDAKTNWDKLKEGISNAHQAPSNYDIPEYPGGHWIDMNDALVQSGVTHSWFFSNMNRAYTIIEIPYPYAGYLSRTDTGGIAYYPKALLNYLEGISATDQIIAMYSMPTYVFKKAFTTGQGMTPTYSDIAASDFEVYNSKQRADSGKYPYNPHCKKLLLHPYTYLRAESSDGTAKEYKYEEFYNVVTNPSTNHCKFKIITDLNGIPTSFIAPWGYKQYSTMSSAGGEGTSDDFSDMVSYNYEERIDITQYPQVPYSIDGYLTHISAEYMNQVANNTSQAQIERDHQQKYLDQLYKHQDKEATAELFGDAANLVGGGLKGAAAGFSVGGPYGALAGLAVGGISGALGLSSDINKNTAMLEQTAAAKDRLQAQYDMLSEANSFMSNPSKENPRFNDTKAAFACNYYKAGTRAGILQTIKGTPYQDIKLTHVHLRTAILQKYDDYFKAYGYNVAGVVDVPYVVKYTQGASSNDDLPHWEQVNGKYSTYVRTQDCHVTHAMLPVTIAIEGMFNSGVRMLKGETL